MWEPRSIVRNGYDDHPIGAQAARQLHARIRSVASGFCGVLQQIDQGLLDQVRIDLHGQARRALLTEQSWRSARANLTIARIAALRRSVTLFKALGGGWSPGDA